MCRLTVKNMEHRNHPPARVEPKGSLRDSEIGRKSHDTPPETGDPKSPNQGEPSGPEARRKTRDTSPEVWLTEFSVGWARTGG